MSCDQTTRHPVLLIAGSASKETEEHKISLAISIVRELVHQGITRNIKFVVYAGREPQTALGTPLVFDWVVLREIDRCLVSPENYPFVYIVTAQKCLNQVGDEERRLISKLCVSGKGEAVYLSDEIHTGGNISDAQLSRATALITIGGGKGVQDRAWKFQRQMKPVLPLDLDIGSSRADGSGSLGVLKKLIERPSDYFPHTFSDVIKKLPSISCAMADVDVSSIANISLNLILREHEHLIANRPVEVLLLTALPVELEAGKLALGIKSVAAEIDDLRTQFWTTEIACSGHSGRAALACFGSAGNVDAASIVTSLLLKLKPKAVVMFGIAAGERGKIKIGEVVLSDRVIYYEPAALIQDNGKSTTTSRHESYRINPSLQQVVANYTSTPHKVGERISSGINSLTVVFPSGAEKDSMFASAVSIRTGAIASGEKLIRDPERLKSIKSIHGKIEAVEMEAAGVVAACARASVPAIVIRGISDFGDGEKNDGAHTLAASVAAAVSVDLIQEQLASIIRG